jgi:hypothetical protein
MREVLDYCCSDGMERAIAGKETLQDKTTLQVSEPHAVDVFFCWDFCTWDSDVDGLRISPLRNACCAGEVRVAQAKARVGARDQGRGWELQQNVQGKKEKKDSAITFFHNTVKGC